MNYDELANQIKQGVTTIPLNSKMQVDYTALANQAKETSQPKGGFFSNLLKEAVKPFAEVGTSAYNAAVATGKVIQGDVKGANQALSSSRNIPLLGETKTAFTGNESNEDATRKIVGYGTEIGSWFVGGQGAGNVVKATLKGKVLQGLTQGAKTGALAGGLGAAGRSQEELKGLGDTAVQTGLGTVGGALFGGVLGAAAPVAGRALQPIETKVSNTIREAIDKGIKPRLASVKTPALAEKFYKRAAEAFNVIKEYSPKVLNEAGEETTISNRAQMLEALAKSKSAVFKEYNTISKQAGAEGATYNPARVTSALDEIIGSKKYNPDIRNYAEKLKLQLGELAGESPEVIEARIQDLNQSLGGFYEGRVAKAQAQVDASVANLMREDLDALIENAVPLGNAQGVNYQALKNKYGALKTIEKDLANQVAVEARRNKAGLLDFTDIFTGGDILAGAITGNPALLIKGIAGKGAKSFMKYINDPNLYIKRAFDVLDEAGKVPAGSSPASRILNKVNPIEGDSRGIINFDAMYNDLIKGGKVTDFNRAVDTLATELPKLQLTASKEGDVIGSDTLRKTLLDKIEKGTITRSEVKKGLDLLGDRAGKVESKTLGNLTEGAVPETALLQEARGKSLEEFVKAKTKRPDYGYGHSPNEDGVPAFDLTQKVDGEQMIPKDMYERWYGSRGTPEDLESISVLKKIKGNPEADVTIYRASPKNEWNYGDWTTLSKKYAQSHAEGNNFKVFSKVVKAKDLKWAMDDVNEFGYFPESTKSQLTEIWKKANKTP